MVTKYMKNADEIVSHHNEKLGCISRKSTIKMIEHTSTDKVEDKLEFSHKLYLNTK